MADLENGTLVEHTKLGVGKVVAVEATAVHVFFPESDKRFAAKLGQPAARALLRTEGFQRDAWLEELSAFALDPQLLEKLKPNGAKDFVDVEAFLHVTATAKRRGTRSTR
jgi:hypothetical protein